MEVNVPVAIFETLSCSAATGAASPVAATSAASDRTPSKPPRLPEIGARIPSPLLAASRARREHHPPAPGQMREENDATLTEGTGRHRPTGKQEIPRITGEKA